MLPLLFLFKLLLLPDLFSSPFRDGIAGGKFPSLEGTLGKFPSLDGALGISLGGNKGPSLDGKGPSLGGKGASLGGKKSLGGRSIGGKSLAGGSSRG